MIKRNANIPSFNFLNQLDIDLEAKRKLSINLSRIYVGSSDVIETPMCKEHGGERILSEWNKVFQENKSKMNDVLQELEESQRLKTGPRSQSKPWNDRKEGTLAYFDSKKINYAPLDATPQASRDKGILRPISIANAIKLLKNSTNSGLPFYTMKSLVKDRVLERFGYYLERKDPCVLFTRTQEQMKTRAVWGYPIVDTANEMRFYSPLLEYQKGLDWRSALLGPESVNKSLTKIIKHATIHALVLVSIDFSAYDTTVTAELQKKVSEYYKYLFQSSYHDDIDYIIRRKSSIGLITPDGVLTGNHGEPSGSTLTNEDDSIAQFIIARKSGVVDDGLFNIQGDDGVYAVHSDKVGSLINCFKKYGLNVNEDKSYQSSNYLIYLQNLYHVDYEVDGVICGIYPTFRALNRILYQERWSNFEEYGIKGSDYYSIRTICILENCKFHPLFKELVQFVLKRDRYNLDVSKCGLLEYIKMLKESSGIEGILINQYGDDVKGFNNFSTVKLLKTLI